MAFDRFGCRLKIILCGERIETLCQRDFPQPGQLPFGKLAGGGGAFFDEGFVAVSAFDVVPRLTVADAAHGGVSGGQGGVFAAQGGHFVEEALPEHLSEAFGDSGVKQGAVFRNQGDGVQVQRRRGCLLFVEVAAEGFSGQLEYF